MSSTLNPNHKGSGTANFTCAVCCRAFHRADHLARHVRSHNNVRPFRCEVCGRTFGRRDVLLRHADQVHRQNGVRKKDASSFRLAQSNGDLGVDESSFLRRSQSIPKRQCIGEKIPATQAVEFVRHSPAQEIVDGIEEVASLRGADLDDFVQRLSRVSSYADLTRVFHKQALPKLNETPIQIYPNILAADYARHIRTQHTPPQSLQVASAYPITSLSEYTIDRLLQSYRENFPFPWIHFPTWDFSPASLLREQPYDGQTHRPCNGWKRQPHRLMLISMLALGASCCHETALALDLYQQVRKGILGWVSRAREEPLPQAFFQAFIGYLAFGITFGDKSLEDLTIGHTISLRALVRDAALEKPKATADEPALCGCGCCADKHVSQWLRWVRVEERKRTFFAYFSVLSSTLMYLDSIATVDWREIGYDLPCGEQAWLADSASAWSEAIRTDPLQPPFAEAVRHLFENYAAVDDQKRPFRTHSSSNGCGGQRQHMDRLLQTEMSCFLLITAVHYEAFHARTQPGPYYDNSDEALERWQALWTAACADMGSEHVERLRSCSTAMFNHTQLVLQANIEEAREALMSRRFKKLHILFLFLDRLPQPGYPLDLPWTSDESQLIENMFFISEQRSAFRHLATCALNALEQSVIYVSKESQRVQIGLHVAASMFYNIQCLCSWLCFFAHCLDRGLYGGDFEWDDNADAKDSRLLESILSFAQNRKLEFNASYEILSSPDDFDRNKAGRLACDLLDVHHHILSRCGTWPLFDHVGDALKGRSLAISDWIDAN